MERQKTTTEVKHMDDYSRALIAAAVDNIHSNYTWAPVMREESIPTLKDNPYGKESTDVTAENDPKKSAAPGDVTKPSGQKQFGAQIKDTTKVVAAESCGSEHGEKKKECSSCGGKGCSKCEMKKEEFEILERHEIEVDGDIFIVEKQKGLDGKACWKGYKQAGTKMKGGKRVDNCIKAGVEYDVDTANQLWSEVREKLETLGEMDGVKFKVLGEKKLDSVNHKELKGDHADRKDKDIDNDGDVDKSDKYLHGRRKKVSKIIAAKKKMKEEAELQEKK